MTVSSPGVAPLVCGRLSHIRSDHRGEPISTATTESTVQRLLHRRMGANQPMRWSPRGAHRMLKVRTAVMNGSLPRSPQGPAQRPRRRRAIRPSSIPPCGVTAPQLCDGLIPSAPEGAAGMTLSINANALICRVSRLENDGSDHFPTVSLVKFAHFVRSDLRGWAAKGASLWATTALPYRCRTGAPPWRRTPTPSPPGSTDRTLAAKRAARSP